MGSVSRLPSPAGGRPVVALPLNSAVRTRSVRVTALGLACFLCGTTIGVRFDVVGDLYLLELLVALLALQCVLSRRPSKGFVTSIFLGFLGAGLITFCGYLLSDLLASNEPSQYLKGWGRVGFLVFDSAALAILAAHGRQNIWWLALGIGVGGVALLIITGVPFTQWKLGYGEYAAILLLALAPLAPMLLAAGLVGGFGVFCIVVDYRSLGAVCLIIATIMLWRSGAKSGKPFYGRLRLMAAILIVVTAIAGLLALTQEQYAERRLESNTGRYVGLVVAWRAIKESPIIGYGSWAADERFARMLRDEAARGGKMARPLDIGRSLLPHSQFLQAWIEGGLFGLMFFALYGWRLVGALRWFAWQKPLDSLTPLFLFFLFGGIWNLLASPFLGIMRIYIAVAVAVIAIAAHERRNCARTRLTGASQKQV